MAYPTNKEMRDVIDDSWRRYRDEFEQEYKIVAWDFAKPGSDQTVVFTSTATEFHVDWKQTSEESDNWYKTMKEKFMDEYRSVKDDLANPEHQATPADLAKPCAPKQSEPDRIWDLIVLAAESSRYG